MKKHYSALSELWRAFLLVLGAASLLLIAQAIVSGYNTVPMARMGAGLGAAAVFSLCHLFVSTDALGERLSLGARFLICLLPSGAAAGYFLHSMGLNRLLGLHDGTHSIAAATFDWFFSLGVGIAVILAAAFLIERRYRRAKADYDRALAGYKRRQGGPTP